MPEPCGPLTDGATAEEIAAKAEAEAAAAAEILEQVRELRDKDEADHAETERQIEGIRAARARRAATFEAAVRPRERSAEDHGQRSERLRIAARIATDDEAKDALVQVLEDKRAELAGKQTEISERLAELSARRRDAEPQLAAALDSDDDDLIAELRTKLDTIGVREERLRAQLAPVVAGLDEIGDGEMSHIWPQKPLAEARRLADPGRRNLRRAINFAQPERPEAIADAEQEYEAEVRLLASEQLAADRAKRATAERKVTYATGLPGAERVTGSSVEVHRRRVVFVFEEAEVPDLARQLVEAIRRGWGVRRAVPPVLLLRLSDEVNEAARGTAPYSSSAGHGAARNLPGLRPLPSVVSSDQPVRLLTPGEAGQVVGASASYVRRLCRQGVLGTRDETGSAWRIDSRELAAWDSARRRKERTQRTA